MFANKVLEVSSTVGTTAYLLGGSPAGSAYRTWRSQFPTGKLLDYWAVLKDGSKWEHCYGALTYGAPDQLARTLIDSSTGALISWTSADVSNGVYVFSAVDNDVVTALMLGVGYAARPPWAAAGLPWSDISAGMATRQIDKLYNGTADVEKGRYEGVPGVYVPSPRRPTLATGTAGLVVTANHIGWRLTFDTAAASRALTLPAISSVDKGFLVSGVGLSALNGVVITPNGTDAVDYGAGGATLTIPGKVPFDLWSDGTQWRTDYVAVGVGYSGVRQTVAAGPVDTSGLPTFLPATATGLAVVSQNVSASAPLVAAAAGGWSGSTGQPVDSVGFATGNLTWGSLTNGATNYLYGTIAGGVITPASTTLAPVYQQGGTPSTVNGQITFNIGEMKAYLGNGTAAVQTALVVFGEAVTSGGNVTATVAYAYNGHYESAFTATLPSAATPTNSNHNIGVTPRNAEFIVENTTSEFGFAVGEQLRKTDLTWSSGNYLNMTLSLTSKSMTFFTGISGGVLYYVINKSTGSSASLTLANWKYKFVANRGW